MERRLHSVHRAHYIKVRCSSELAEAMIFAARRRHVTDNEQWLTMALGSFCAHIEESEESETQELFAQDIEADTEEPYTTRIVADEKLFSQYVQALSLERDQDATRLWNRILLFALEQ